MSGRTDGKSAWVRRITHLSPAGDPGSKSTSTKTGFISVLPPYIVENTFLYVHSRSRDRLVEAVPVYAAPGFPLNTRIARLEHQGKQNFEVDSNQ